MVDDEPSVTLTLSTKLQRAGYDCLTASSAEEALAQLARRVFDLVVTDVRMPGISGIDLLKQIKDRDAEMQVIVMTAYADADFAVQALRLSADDYLLKPFDLDDLIRGVRRALEHRRLLRENRAYRQHLEWQVGEQAEQIGRLFLGGLVALARAIEARDPCTGSHLERVTELALAVGTELDLGLDVLRTLWLAALLHDVGKLAIPDSVLSKPGPLTLEEYELMKSHPERGAKILEDVWYLQPAVPAILHHHERWEGTGYPAGLKGEEIPLEGRILAVVDAWDAMLGDRPYRRALAEAEAIAELERGAGTQFDPGVVAAFLKSRAKGFRAQAPRTPGLHDRVLQLGRSLPEVTIGPLRPGLATVAGQLTGGGEGAAAAAAASGRDRSRVVRSRVRLCPRQRAPMGRCPRSVASLESSALPRPSTRSVRVRSQRGSGRGQRVPRPQARRTARRSPAPRTALVVSVRTRPARSRRCLMGLPARPTFAGSVPCTRCRT